MVERDATRRKGINVGHYLVLSAISSVQMQTDLFFFVCFFFCSDVLAGRPSLFSAFELPLLRRYWLRLSLPVCSMV